MTRTRVLISTTKALTSLAEPLSGAPHKKGGYARPIARLGSDPNVSYSLTHIIHAD